MNILKPFAFLTTALLLAVVVGCRDANDSHGHSRAGKSAHSHGHSHSTPHGGTPVVIGSHQFHLELVLDAAAGKMQAYVLDGHLEGYIQVPENSFALVVTVGGTTEQLSFQRAPEPESGNVPAKSPLFEAQGEWLKTTKEFQGNIPTITLDGKTFTNILFPFPKGSKHVH